MTAWDYAKSKGTTLKEMSIATDQSLATLRNWYNNEKKRKVFDLVIKGIKESI